MIRTRMTTRTTARPRRRAPADRPATRPGGVPTDNGQRTTDKRGFTLIELMVVVVVLAILMALLLPAINGALRTARNSAVQSEINQIAAALESFKSKYGDYPPSRVYLAENGDYSVVNAGSTSLSVSTVDPTSPGGTNDITVAQLAARTLSAFRKFWPRAQFSTSGVVFGSNSTRWYDFNGNGQMDLPYVLHGHECLVFFLGGVPLYDASTASYTLTGFGKDPTNPFSNMILNNSMYNANRQTPYYEFNPGRLFIDPSNQLIPNTQVLLNIPAYYDSLNGGPPTGPPLSGLGPVNFLVYFSAYGNGNYDPNDVNLYETDQNQTPPPGTELMFAVNFPIPGSTTNPPIVASPGPNPYTTTLTAQTTSGTVTYQKPQTYQIISSGADGLYGVGGQYVAQTISSTQPLPLDANHVANTSDASVRQREIDNLTNFKQGTLQ